MARTFWKAAVPYWCSTWASSEMSMRSRPMLPWRVEDCRRSSSRSR